MVAMWGGRVGAHFTAADAWPCRGPEGGAAPLVAPVGPRPPARPGFASERDHLLGLPREDPRRGASTRYEVGLHEKWRPEGGSRDQGRHSTADGASRYTITAAGSASTSCWFSASPLAHRPIISSAGRRGTESL